MSIPERIPSPVEEELLCEFAKRWLISLELAYKLAALAYLVPYPLQIISGWRDQETQAGLLAKPDSLAAADQLSTHRSCPATGADVWPPSVAIVNAVKAEIGAAGSRVGLRWGGGSRVDPGTGIPSDWNHFDLGRRG